MSNKKSAKQHVQQYMGWSYHNDKERYMNMPIDRKRREYKCHDNYFTLDHLQTWGQYTRDLKPKPPEFSVNPEINEKITLFTGDIVALEVDAIVNAANPDLRGGGGVDEVIHRAAGKEMLQSECRTLNGCATGMSKITGGYKLPAKYIIHTVGPVGENPDQLASSYTTSLELMLQHQLRSIAFPCISTGVYGYPNENAAHIALRAVRVWLEVNSAAIDRIIFCLFQEKDIAIYKQLMPFYFPYKTGRNNQEQNNYSSGNLASKGNLNVNPNNIGWRDSSPDRGNSNANHANASYRDRSPAYGQSRTNHNNARAREQSPCRCTTHTTMPPAQPQSAWNNTAGLFKQQARGDSGPPYNIITNQSAHGAIKNEPVHCDHCGQIKNGK